MRRPKHAPTRIPGWAWQWNRWLLTRPKLRGKRPGPRRLPSWAWPWRRWRNQPHPTSTAAKPAVNPKPKPKPKPVTMYDSVNLDEIPKTAHAVAGYVGGHWPTYPELAKRWPHAKRLSIAVAASEDADCLDVEKGDARPDQAPAWVKRQLLRGVSRPAVYASVSQMEAVRQELRNAGIGRHEVREWTAHYTGRPHRCTRACGFGYTGRADATQYTDKAQGRNLDASVCAPSFFDEE